MNQILSTDMPKKTERKHKSSIHSIVIVFSVFLIIFGLGLTSSGVYMCYRNVTEEQDNNLATATNTKPTITTERESASIIYIVVEHDKELESVTYAIDGEEIEVELSSNQTSVKEKVELPVGESTLTITAKDINGVSSSYENTYAVDQKPTITLEQVETQILVTTESTIAIDYVQYYWDDDEESGETFEINDVKNETYVDVIEGEHTLNVIAVDIDGNEATTYQKIKGNTKPEISITTDGEVFKITITDDEELAKIGIRLEVNDEIVDTTVEDVTDKEYTATVEVEEGVNRITVIAYDNYGLTSTLVKKYTKEQ